MASPSRFTKIGTAGRTGVDSGKSAGRTDPYRRTIVIPVTTLTQTLVNTGVDLPPNCQISSAFVNVITPETVNPTATLSVGTPAIGVSNILAPSTLALAGFTGIATKSNIEQDEITYNISVADFVDLEAEIVIEVLASDL